MTRPSATVLVADDDAATREGLTALLETWGYRTRAASNGEEALKVFEECRPDAFVTDLMMPGLNGLEVVQRLGQDAGETAVILLTGHGTIDTAVQAIKLGAYDYLTKPVDTNRLRSVLEKGVRQVKLARESSALRQRLESPLGSYGSLIGKSPPMRQLYQQLARIAGTDAPVLVSGESGTGKELVARTIHDLSPRREGPFLAINCPAIPGTLWESEIFGHEKGAFTGALGRRVGSFEEADGGTLFLDEVTEIAPEMQAKFLRVLEEGQVRRIGASNSFPVSVRVVAATNRPPSQAVKEGKLRPDLFYRLSVFQLDLPPLRERGDDIVLLARYFLEEFTEKSKRPMFPWTDSFTGALKAHPWPGNVRELKNAMERLAVLAPGPGLTNKDMEKFCFNAIVEELAGSQPVSLADAERQAIERALAATGGNKTQAARLLGITPKTLNAKISLYRSGADG